MQSERVDHAGVSVREPHPSELASASSASARGSRAPKQGRSERTRARILEAAESLLRECGSSGVSIRDICARADASASSFYARFDDREELIRVVFERFAARVAEVPNEIRERTDALGSLCFERFIREGIRDYAAFWREEAGLVQALRQCETDDEELYRRRVQLDRGIVQGAIDLVESRHGDEVSRAVVQGVEANIGIIAAAFRGVTDPSGQLGLDGPEAGARAADAFADLVLGLIRPAGDPRDEGEPGPDAEASSGL